MEFVLSVKQKCWIIKKRLCKWNFNHLKHTLPFFLQSSLTHSRILPFKCKLSDHITQAPSYISLSRFRRWLPMCEHLDWRRAQQVTYNIVMPLLSSLMQRSIGSTSSSWNWCAMLNQKTDHVYLSWKSFQHCNAYNTYELKQNPLEKSNRNGKQHATAYILLSFLDQ